MNNIIERIWNQNKMVQIEDLKGCLFQDESAGHTFRIYGIDDAGNTVALSGTPSGIFHRPDNTDVTLSCSVSGGVVSATLPSTCYDVPGRGGITVFITADNQKTAIYAAVVTVSRTESGTVAPPATQDVVDLVNAISAAVATIPASYSDLMADIAPTYSSSALYAVGQYAWYDGDLKRCIVPITTAESYTAAHWTSAVLGSDVSDLKSAFDTPISALMNGVLIIGEQNILDDSLSIDGKDISANGTISSYSGRKLTDYIAVNEGDIINMYYINSSQSVAALKFFHLAAFDSSLNAVESASPSERATTYTVPNGVRFIRVSFSSSANNPMFIRNNTSSPTAYVAYAKQTAVDKEIPDMKQDITDLESGLQTTDNKLNVVEKNVSDWYFEKEYINSQIVRFQFDRVISKAYFRILSSTGTINNLNIYVSATGWTSQTLLKAIPIDDIDEMVVSFDMTGYTSVRFTFGFTASATGTTKVIIHPFDGVSIPDDLIETELKFDNYTVPDTEITGTNYNQYIISGAGTTQSPYRVQYVGETATNPTQYNVMQYPVTAGNIYILSGFDVSLRADIPLAGFGTTAIVESSNITIQEKLLDGTSTMTDYMLRYKPVTDGYIFVAWITGREKIRLYNTVRVSDKYTEANNPFKIKIQLFGDSITDNKWGDQFTWADLIKYNLSDYSVTVVDDAVGGSGIGHGKSESTSSHQTEDYNYVYDLVTDGTTLQTDADYIVILVGTNNWKSGTPLGDMTSTGYDTVYGALKGIIEYISTHTQATVFVCTIPQRYNADDQARPTNEYGEPLYNGLTLAEYCEPFKVASAFYGMPCVHLNEALGWNRINITDFTVDGLHPNYHGDKMISAMICSEIRKHIGAVPY